MSEKIFEHALMKELRIEPHKLHTNRLRRSLICFVVPPREKIFQPNSGLD